MGKLKQRRKLHIPAKNSAKGAPEAFNTTMDTSQEQPILLKPGEDLFAGINISLDSLNVTIPSDDARSVKSFKSLKSESGKRIPKKDKIKLRRETLLKKIDAVNQMKLDSKRRRKRKNVSIIGDTNPLHDALPSLESLQLKSAESKKPKTKEAAEANDMKSKGTEKASKRKKSTIQGVKLFKQLMANKEFKKDPLKAIGEHVQAIFTQTQAKSKAKR